MNIQSLLLLVVILSAFVYTILYIMRKNRRHPGCGSCNCCSDGHCCLRRK